MSYEDAQMLTRRWLAEAGLEPGMRVLDLGCGPGSVSALVLPLVQPGGSIVGVDRDPAHLETARARHAGMPLELHQTDLTGPLPASLGHFDAVVTRRVLMYLPDPVAALRAALAHLRPGGLLFVQELILLDNPTGLPLHDEVRGWLRRMLEVEGASFDLGRHLPRLFAEAGLPWPQVRAEADLAVPGHEDDLPNKVRFCYDRILAAGVDPARVGLEDLGERLRAEREAAGLAWVGELAVAAWARRPG